MFKPQFEEEKSNQIYSLNSILSNSVLLEHNNSFETNPILIRHHIT